jgi:hypothetical protein
MGKRIITALIAVSTTGCWAQLHTPSSAEGGITGVVLREDGTVAAGMKVCLSEHYDDGSWINQTSTSCRGLTDQNGRFTIEHVKKGTYQISAMNDGEGYSLDSQMPGENVTIRPDQLWPDVTVHLRNLGGVIEGVITDKFTGKKIPGAVIYYADIDNGGSSASLRTDGSYQVSVPAGSALLVFAVADGYKGWVYQDTSQPKVLKLQAGQRTTLEIQMEPRSKSVSEAK